MADIVVKELPDQLALTVGRRVSMQNVAEAMGQAFGALMAHAEATGAHWAGPPFCYYPGPVGEEFDVVVCMPVVPGASAGEGVALETVAGGKVASTMHRGPYAAVGETYAGLQAWMDAHGHTPAGPPREVYLNDPANVPESDLLTEIDWPIA